MANKRLDHLRNIDPVLSTLVQMQKNDLYISDKLFPTVKVKKNKGSIPVFGKDAFVARETNRSLRADSNRIPASDFTLAEYETIEQDLEMAIDYLESNYSNSYAKYEQVIAKQLWDALALNREIDICNHLQDKNKYPAENVLELQANQAFNKTTSDTVIVHSISNGKERLRKATGVIPDTMITDNATISAILNNKNIADYRAKYVHPILDPLKFISDLFRIENIILTTSVYSADNVNFKDIWAHNLVLTYSGKKANNPKLGYIIQREGMPEVDTYFENGGKTKVIRCTDNYCWKVATPEAAYLIANTISE